MRLIKIIFLFLLSTGAVFSSQAQKNNTRRTNSSAGYKPPKLYTSLGDYTDSATVNAGDTQNIIAMPLTVTDAGKNIYTVTSYQFLYRQNVVTEDEETGKASEASSILSERFKTTPLPERWINKIRENLKTGELLYFFDIIAKDSHGRVMYAPGLKITVQ